MANLKLIWSADKVNTSHILITQTLWLCTLVEHEPSLGALWISASFVYLYKNNHSLSVSIYKPYPLDDLDYNALKPRFYLTSPEKGKCRKPGGLEYWATRVSSVINNSRVLCDELLRTEIPNDSFL